MNLGNLSTCLPFIFFVWYILSNFFRGTPTPFPSLLSGTSGNFHSLLQQASSSQRSQPKELPAHAQLTLQALLVFSPFKGLTRVSWAGGLLAESAYTGEARCSLLALWGQLESLYKECLFGNHTACSVLPCSVCSCLFLFWYGNLLNMCIYSHYFNSHKHYLQPDLHFISWILITAAFKKHIHSHFQSLFKHFNLC